MPERTPFGDAPAPKTSRDEAIAGDRRSYELGAGGSEKRPLVAEPVRRPSGGCCGFCRTGPDFRGAYADAESPEQMKAALTAIGVAHTIEDFADAQSSRLFYKSWSYCFGGLSELLILGAAVSAFLAGMEILKDDGPQIAAFVAGGLALVGLSLQKLSVYSQREYSQRTNEVNRYIRAYALGIEPHVLLEQLNGHVASFTDSERKALAALTEKVNAFEV